MKTKSPKEQKVKIPARPRSTQSIGDMIAWARYVADNPELKGKRRDFVRHVLEIAPSLSDFKDAEWSSRTWIKQAVGDLESLPHVVSLGIQDIRKRTFTGKGQKRLIYAASLRLRDKFLHHINFQYFTMPCR